METNNTTRKVKSPEEWEHDIEREAHGKLGQWKILPREIFSSKAYRSLSLAEREVLHCYLNKVQYHKRDKKAEQRRMKRSGSTPSNGDSLICTNNEIRARGGVKSDKTISRARKRLVEIGFLDVVQPSAFPNPGIFSLSSRYTKYPDGDYAPENAKPVSFARYSRSCTAGSNKFTPACEWRGSSTEEMVH